MHGIHRRTSSGKRSGITLNPRLAGGFYTGPSPLKPVSKSTIRKERAMLEASHFYAGVTSAKTYTDPAKRARFSSHFLATQKYFDHHDKSSKKLFDAHVPYGSSEPGAFVTHRKVGTSKSAKLTGKSPRFVVSASGTKPAYQTAKPIEQDVMQLQVRMQQQRKYR